MPDVRVPLLIERENFTYSVGEALVNEATGKAAIIIDQEKYPELAENVRDYPDQLVLMVGYNDEDGYTDVTIDLSLDEVMAADGSCDHHWIAMHEPGHILYWVKVCSICHEPDWYDLDQAIMHLMNNTDGRHIDMLGTEPKESEPSRNEAPSKPFNPLTTLPMQEQAKFVVRVWLREHLDVTDKVTIRPDDVYVVWFVKVLQNWKALVSTNLPDGMYYEVTYNGEMREIYLDAYKKFDNVTFQVPELYLPAQQIEVIICAGCESTVVKAKGAIQAPSCSLRAPR